ncbi:hypothetical protein [Halococcus salifodinae]|uniref:Uncharacterized protein n=1 Tax=Halococcus salifodinae DSM 8989 TaxID=1227456 RepID=M0NCX2_9EURY|nr:hypothetical protein [Halococcus salifodinae]EMA54500.1 hypothetical protein C450_05565 [Halococcus salifodinae DSM 8989]
MTKFSAGTVAWAIDPTDAHDERPVIILSHEKRPFSSVECTVMCLGTGAKNYDHYSPELEDDYLSGVSFTNTTYLMPWALYTIPPGAIQTGKASGELTEKGERFVKKALISLFSV